MEQGLILTSQDKYNERSQEKDCQGGSQSPMKWGQLQHENTPATV